MKEVQKGATVGKQWETVIYTILIQPCWLFFISSFILICLKHKLQLCSAHLKLPILSPAWHIIQWGFLHTIQKCVTSRSSVKSAICVNVGHALLKYILLLGAISLKHLEHPHALLPTWKRDRKVNDTILCKHCWDPQVLRDCLYKNNHNLHVCENVLLSAAEVHEWTGPFC